MNIKKNVSESTLFYSDTWHFLLPLIDITCVISSVIQAVKNKVSMYIYDGHHLTLFVY